MTLLVVVALLPLIAVFGLRRYAARVDRFASPGHAVVSMVAASAAVTAFVYAAGLALSAVLISEPNHVVARTVAGALLAAMVWRTVEAARHLHRVAENLRVAAEFGRRADPLTRTLIIDEAAPDAFAVSSGGGAVVITSGLAQMLSPAELDAIVAHERAHLRYRHNVSIQVTETAAHLLPWLRVVSAAVRHQAERQADECAALDDRKSALHLIVGAAEKFEAAVAVPANSVTGSEHPNPGLVRVCDESACRPSESTEIAAGDGGRRQVQLADSAARGRPKPTVEHPCDHAGHGRADAESRSGGQRFGDRDAARRLRRAVGVAHGMPCGNPSVHQ